MTSLIGNWNYPTTVRFGPGRISELPDVCRELGMARPLFVTDEGLAALKIVDDAIGRCIGADLAATLFSGVDANPTGENIEAGLAAFNEGGCDGVIAFGGGSSLDAGKAVAFMARQTRPIWDFEDVGDNWTRAIVENLPPVIAVPTTSGTGSEVGRASVILDKTAQVKKIIFHPRMLPEIVLADPDLTLGLPPGLTAATGMDALSHNLEAFFAPGYHPLARGIAVEGARLVKEWLPTAVGSGDNADARANMMAASQAGATAFQRGLGGMHALAHTLGALHGSHHGLLNAILMPYVMSANRSAIVGDAEYLARCLSIDGGFDGLLEWVIDLRDEIGIPSDLAAIDVNDSDRDRVGQMAFDDPSAGGNPVQFSAKQYSALFQFAVNGKLPVLVE